MSAVSIPIETFDLKAELKPQIFIYLPNEALQGENIPSHILLENAKVEHIQVSFSLPLKLKEVFNVEDYQIRDNHIIVKKLELEGYVGLLFNSIKVVELELVVPVEYLIHLSNGDVIREVREIRLFRPQLDINVKTKQMTIDPDTGFVKGRVGIKNIGRGTLIIGIFPTEDSSIKLETPSQYREFAQNLLSDLLDEFAALAEEFPQFKTIVDEMPEWEGEGFMELSEEERDELMKFSSKLATVLASDKDLLLGFAEAYAKALAKNTELIESVRKLIKVWESLVSKDILLFNPFDEVVLQEKGNVDLKISQTDSIFDVYDDISLPKIELNSAKPIKVPVYRLFEWG